MKKKIYISLPITGEDIDKVKERAKRVKDRLTKYGMEVITPFDVCDEKDKSYSYYMGKDIEALIDCDAIYMCNGWSKSKGCQAELHIAVVYEKDIEFESKDWRK